MTTTTTTTMVTAMRTTAPRGLRAAVSGTRAARCVRARALDPKKTAVVLIEYQNDFVSEGGKLHDGVKTVMELTNMLANTINVVDEARSKVSPDSPATSSF